MKLWDFAQKIGAAAIATAVPGGPLILQGINELLPEDKKLPEAATGTDLVTAVESLPPEQRVALMDKELDVELTQIKESNATLRAMLEADAAGTHTTRPYIARGSFQLVAAVSLIVISIWAYAVATGNVGLVKEVMSGWQFVAAVLAPFIGLLWAYFGILKQEQRNRLDAASGNTNPGGLAGIISALKSK